MCAGILGLVMAPLLRGDGKGLVFTWSLDSAQLLGWNMAGMAATIAWTGATTGLVFWGLDNYNMLRWLLLPEIKGWTLRVGLANRLPQKWES